MESKVGEEVAKYSQKVLLRLKIPYSNPIMATVFSILNPEVTYTLLYKIIQTVVTKQRIRSQEFIDFLEFLNGKGVGVFVTYAKPVGDWEGKFDVLVNRDDMDYMRELEKKYNVFTHLTPSYGLNLGCISVKRMFSVTQYGDVMPCPYIHVSLGNFFEEPLKDIIERGLNIKWFGKYMDTCLIAEDRKFINDYVVKKIYGKPLPVPWYEVFTGEDFIEANQRQLFRQ